MVESAQRTEHRWPVVAFTVAALGIHALLPDTVRVTPSWLVPAIGAVILVPLLAVNPRRLNRETTWSKWISVALALGLAGMTQVSIVLIIRELVAGRATGPAVLLTALGVWLINVIAFALVYWEIDRGGPVARRVAGYRDGARQDFRFPQEEPGATVPWMPVFFDYVYFSLSNMMAFSPTDVMPLTIRAKALMGYQAPDRVRAARPRDLAGRQHPDLSWSDQARAASASWYADSGRASPGAVTKAARMTPSPSMRNVPRLAKPLSSRKTS